MTAAAQNQAFPVASEGQAVFLCVQIHAFQGWCVFQGDGVGALLIELQEITPMFVKEWKMSCNNKRICMDFSMIRDGCIFCKFLDGGVFVDGQFLGNGGEKFQGMKLGLLWKLHRSHSGEGERQLLC